MKNIGSSDVIVAGGGTAGFSAAVSAARAGADTILIERSGVLGGVATAGLMNAIGNHVFTTSEICSVRGTVTYRTQDASGGLRIVSGLLAKLPSPKTLADVDALRNLPVYTLTDLKAVIDEAAVRKQEAAKTAEKPVDVKQQEPQPSAHCSGEKG